MHEKRRLRFASIEGLAREELPVAAEVWLDELRQQAWVTRDALKIGTLFKRYLSDPDPQMLELNYIERHYSMDEKQVIQALRMMKIYGALEGYARVDDSLRVSLHLSYLQRLRVLEIRHRFGVLQSPSSSGALPWHRDTEVWAPEVFEDEEAFV